MVMDAWTKQKNRVLLKFQNNEFEFHNAHCFKIHVPQIGAAQAIYYDVAALMHVASISKTIELQILLFILWPAESGHLQGIFIRKFTISVVRCS